MSTSNTSNSTRYGNNVVVGSNVIIGSNCLIGNNVTLHDNVKLGNNCIVRSNVIIGESNFIELVDNNVPKSTIIGANSIIGAGSIIYSDSIFGRNLRVGNNVVIRENTLVGDGCSIGTFSDIQGRLVIGNFVRIHSKCFIPEGTIIKDFAWIYPSVTLTNDLYPPHSILKPIIIEEYAQVGAATVILPGVTIGKNSLVGAGSVVTKSVSENTVTFGSPAKEYRRVSELMGPNNEQLYPWKDFLLSKKGYPWES